MTAKLQQRQRERGDPSPPERGSATRSNVVHPPALPLPDASPRAKRLDCGGRAQRRHRFRPHPTPPITERNHPHHSSFVIRHLPQSSPRHDPLKFGIRPFGFHSPRWALCLCGRICVSSVPICGPPRSLL